MTYEPPALAWAIKRDFLRYIAAMPDGRCSVTDGADLMSDPGGDCGQFSFVLDRADHSENGMWTFTCRGDVRFAGHHGFLYVRIADPTVIVRGEEGLVTIASCEDDLLRIPLVRFTRRTEETQTATTWHGTDVRLTSEGSELFGGVYPEGEIFDDLTFTLPASLTTSPT